MAFFSFGISHKTASVAIREQVVFTADVIDSAITDLKSACNVDEAVIVSTCNRTEVYLSAQKLQREQVIRWLVAFHQVNEKELADALYFREEQDAVNHLMAVASGLDSLVLGEPQILGQLKQALSEAKNTGHVSGVLHKLFDKSFSVAKDVRTSTEIGSSAVSVAFAAVSLAKHIFAKLDDTKVLLVGAGETIELVAKHLFEAGCRNVTVANRTLERAQQLADVFDAEVVTLSDIPSRMANADLVVSSTAAPLPIIGKGMVEKALKTRLNQPMLLVDIAVPRDIEAEVNELENVYLYTVDDLQGIVQKNQQQRVEASKQAEKIIEKEVVNFYDWLETLKSVDYVKQYRQQCLDTKTLAIDKAVKQLKQGTGAEQVVLELANQLTAKLMHQPTSMIRQAAKLEQLELIEFITEQLGIQPK